LFRGAIFKFLNLATNLICVLNYALTDCQKILANCQGHRTPPDLQGDQPPGGAVRGFPSPLHPTPRRTHHGLPQPRTHPPGCGVFGGLLSGRGGNVRCFSELCYLICVINYALTDRLTTTSNCSHAVQTQTSPPPDLQGDQPPGGAVRGFGEQDAPRRRCAGWWGKAEEWAEEWLRLMSPPSPASCTCRATAPQRWL
jgi:hypothetical protein